ncbi:hypothetical protein C8R46DRAFT_38941 [Mycena filopes]|nr:hypothetical protein C8R46DRAFT_38941 [Mycena filopes]
MIVHDEGKIDPCVIPLKSWSDYQLAPPHKLALVLPVAPLVSRAHATAATQGAAAAAAPLLAVRRQRVPDAADAAGEREKDTKGVFQGVSASTGHCERLFRGRSTGEQGVGRGGAAAKGAAADVKEDGRPRRWCCNVATVKCLRIDSPGVDNLVMEEWRGTSSSIPTRSRPIRYRG